MLKSNIKMGSTTKGFENALSKGEDIDCRLNEPIWKDLQPGMIIEFLEDPGDKRRYYAKIENIYTAGSFIDLFNILPLKFVENLNRQEAVKWFTQWWDVKEQQKWGVLGIQFKIISRCEVNIMKQLKDRLERTNQLYLDLVEFIGESNLSSKLCDLPSNTIGQQLWCVIGARNSFLKAAQAGSWQGFSCPLNYGQTIFQSAVRESLLKTGKEILSFLEEQRSLDENQIDWMLGLLEHEAQHHGQLIRYLYGLKLGVPQSWKERYSLD